MAQFSHSDFGGMSQWSAGMAMVGDMFNNSLKIETRCRLLGIGRLYRRQTDRGRREDGEVSYQSSRQRSNWWPDKLKTPSAVGAQNDIQYAVFPDTRRLAIKDGGHVEIYDTGNHGIFSVAQAQSADHTLIFTSQDGLVRVKDLPKLRDEL
jgi:hypothetical protein